VLERRQPGADRLELRTAVDPAPAVEIAVDRQQHLRLDLREAVDHAAGPELR
jgi:hypothetical protein